MHNCKAIISAKDSLSCERIILFKPLLFYIFFFFCIYEQILPDTDFGIYKWNAASNRT